VHPLPPQRLGKALGDGASRFGDALARGPRGGAVERLAHQVDDALHAAQRLWRERLGARMPLERQDAAAVGRERFQHAVRAPRDDAHIGALLQHG
jgi:hypothetical protein